MASSALRSSTGFLATATTYSRLGSASRKSSSAGCAKPPSRRTRMRTPGKKERTIISRRRRIPTAPTGAVTLPGRSTAAHRYFGFVVEANEAHHRQVAPAVVVSVEEGQLLCAMSWIVGRIQVDGDATGVPAQALRMALDHPGRQGLPHPV